MQADFALDYDVLTLEQPQKLYLMARFASGPAPSDRNRRPLNLSLVIDRSGSMAGDKLAYTRQASQFLVQNLGADDTLSIVLYNDRVETLLAPEKVQRKDFINQQIATAKAGGTTNLSSGWLQGCTLVADNLSPEHINRVILMSDGLANRGVTQTDRLVALAKQKLGEGVSTTAMGLGRDFNEDLLMAMASAGGGAYYFIESPEVAPIIFQEELQGLLNVMGQNLTISIVPGEDVAEVEQLNAYPTDRNLDRIVYRLGDVFGDEVKMLLLALTIPALAELGERQIATLRFEYDELTDNGSQHHQLDFPVRVNVAESKPELANPEVEQSRLLLLAAQARQNAVKSADYGDYANASQALRRAVTEIDNASIHDARLTEERKALLRQAEEFDQGAESYNEYSRKMMSTQAYYTMTSRHEDTMSLRLREEGRIPDQHSKPVSGDGLPTHVTWNGKTFELVGDLIRLGRSHHNEIVISAKGVSRFHCQISRKDNRLLLEDLDSTNGTVVDGTTIIQPHELHVGDVVYLCDEKLIFHEGDSA